MPQQDTPQMSSLMPKKPQYEFAGFFIVLVSSLALISILLNNTIELDRKMEALRTKQTIVATNTFSGDVVYCTQEAKRCTDGSYVSRTGPNCAFAECGGVVANTNAAVDAYAGWQTYTNMVAGFSIKYPSDWVTGNTVDVGGVLGLRTKERQAQIDSGRFTYMDDMQVIVYFSNSDLPNNKNNLSLADWIKDPNIYLVNNVKPITIDGISGYQAVVFGESENYFIYVENNGKIYSIETTFVTSPTEVEQKIIDSIVFTTSAVDRDYTR